MTRHILYAIICLMAVAGQEKCDAVQIHSATSAMEISVMNFFPENIEINESCVAEACPALTKVSLCTSDLIVDALISITKILNDCMKRSMCGIFVDARPIHSLLVSMEEYLPGMEIDGICTLLPGTGFLSNISNMQLDKPPTEKRYLPLLMTMLIPNLRIHGRIQLDFRLETVFGPALTASLTQTTYDIGVQFISTISVNKTIDGETFDIEFENPIVRAQPLFCGIDMPSGFPDIQSLFTATAQMIVEKSSLAKAMGKFIGRLYKSAIQLALNNCKPSNATV